ncbi:unnamed protein product [Leptosia nina]|uniref:Cytochrome c oxidase polypeptide VIIc n=1 Tax=Leptosia nina TaxID=320188 RepID=A0AAV1K2W1_9NEOP
MLGLRQLIVGGCRGRTFIKMMPTSRPIIRLHHDEYSKPFDNLPFTVTNRYVLTAVFCVLFGVGWWAPWIILWYSMAKRTM